MFLWLCKSFVQGYSIFFCFIAFRNSFGVFLHFRKKLSDENEGTAIIMIMGTITGRTMVKIEIGTVMIIGIIIDIIEIIITTTKSYLR